MRLSLTAIFATVLITASSANAAAALQFEYLGSGQVVSPTDEVVIRGRITMWATAPWWMRSALSPAF